ncbi:MAG TPA: PKD domain-containing protein, partial [Bacteroidia bacterium]|nr:PKD domain-containing protein [Bacteroidia bacterium]
MKLPFTLLLCFFSAVFYAEANKNSTSLKATTVFSTKPFERKAFIENRKQFKDNLPAQYQDFQYCIDNNSQILFTKHGLTHVVKKYDHKKLGALSVFMSEEKRETREHEFDIKTQYISLEWLNANPNVEVEVGEVQAGSYNYVMRPQGEKPYTEMCKGYSKLTYKNLYDGIDVEYFFTEMGGFKYNLIVAAGADISQVKMQYSGDVKLVEKEGNIIIKTLKGDIIDHAPISYLADNSSEHITSSFNLKDNIVSFAVNNPNKQAITIDPWTLTPTSANPAYDNGVDGIGNIYLYGGVQGNYIAEKYTSAGALIWSLSNGTTNGYYGDMLVESGGNFYLSDGFNPAGANTYKYSSTSAPIWVSTVDPNFREHWRISLNCVTNQVIVVGGGTTVPTDNIAQIAINTGALTNVLSFGGAHDDMSGLCVDVAGKSYVHGGISNTIVFTNTSNSAIGTVGSGYNQSEIGISTPSYYPNNSANGYNMMALGGATFLFTTDGATLKKWDRNTFALLGSVAIPGGSQNLASGILADNCNNVFVGSTNGVYRFDFNLVQKEYQATTAAVFDIAYSPNSDIIACGAGFFADLAFGRETCGSLQTVLTVNPCNPNINTVSVHPVVSNTSNPPYSFLWDDGNTDSTRTNLSPGKHIVTVKDASCIPQFTKDTIVIAAGAPLTVVKKTPCFNAATGTLQVYIGASQQITSYSITPVVSSSLTNDSTITATALATGTYTFHVVSSSGCAFDSAITLNQLTAISATTQSLTAAICPGNHTGSGQVTANGSSPYIAAGSAPYIYSWNTLPIQTTSVVTGVKEGTYAVTITDSVGCSVKDSVTIFANSNPHAAFANTTVCQGVATAYTDQSVPVAPSVSPISTWSWDFNHDGTIDNTTQNPNFTFPASGTYTTSLVISDGNGCKDSVLMPVNVYPNPTINFSSTAACFGIATTFANTSTIAAPDNIASWSWTFGEGTSSSVIQNPSYTYTTAINSTQNTTYNIQLLATSNFGCKDSLTKPVMVYALPTASFTADSVCLYNASHLTDASNGNGNPLTTYNWDVTGDNISDLSGTPTSYTFNLTANNIVNYTVTTTPVAGLTCTNFTTQNVYVNPLPQPAFTFTNACINMQPTNFDASASTISVGTNSLYSWSFGDTQTGVGVNTTHIYNNAQNYTVLLTVTSNKGCTDTVSHTIITYPKPIINFSSTQACFGMATTFANTSAIAAPDNIASWGWTFGEGVSSSVSQNPSYAYITASNVTQNTTYNVQLLATSNHGCKDSLTKPVVVYSLPTASFTADSVCLNNTSHLTDASNGNGNPLTTYNWDVTNDNVSDLNGTPTSYNFALVGNNVVNYTVTTTPVAGLTCTNFTTQNVYVNPLPQPAFTFTNACVNMQPTNFDASASTISIGTNNLYSWSFGDTQAGVGVNTTHTYANAQNYTVLLTVTSNKGCTDTVSHTITTYPKPTINFSSTPACFGMATTFANTSSIAAPDNITSWNWTFGEGVSSSVS